MRSPKVSIILPIYNGESTLDATLQSLFLQTFKNFEIICCLDGCSDKSEQIVQNYSEIYKNLIIIKNKKNLGLGPTLNRLFAITKGEFVAMAEQDDIYYPERIELQVEIFEKYQEIGMVSGVADFWDGNSIKSRFPGILLRNGQYPKGENMFMYTYREQIKVVNSCMMVRKKIHIENGLYFTQHFKSISVDWTYILRFSLVSNIYGINKSLVRLDRRTNRKSVTSDKKKQFAAARELIRSFLFEKKEMITNEDFRYAMNTQRLLEIGHYKFTKYSICIMWYYLVFGRDSRFLENFKKKFSRIWN